MEQQIKNQGDNGFGFVSGVKYFKDLWTSSVDAFGNRPFANLGIKSVEYRVAGYKDASLGNQWPELILTVMDSKSSKFFPLNLRFARKLTADDVKAINDAKDITDFSGWWGIYTEKSVDVKTGENKVETRVAALPRVTALVLDGKLHELKGPSAEFQADGFVRTKPAATPEEEQEEEQQANA